MRPEREVKPPTVAPACPDAVRHEPAAKKCWDRSIKLLTVMKVLTEADGDLLAHYCMNHAEIEYLQDLVHAGWARQWDEDNACADALDLSTVEGRAKAKLDRQDAVAENQGLVQALGKLQAARKLALHYERELGLTPAARNKVQTVGDAVAVDDPWAALDGPSLA